MRNQLVALGLGSNLDFPIEFLRKALQEIKKIEFLRVIKVASIYESDAQLPEKAPADWNLQFLNSVVICEVPSTLQPLELLYSLKNIELHMGRLTSERWAPRTIDIDILYWENVNFTHADLAIPHPRLTERPFALLPLLEVWPEVQIHKPSWAENWISEKPFNTVKSSKYFWPRFVAVMNITPDSFSDGGMLLEAENLLKHAEKQLQAGAEILDVGAESTRPQAHLVSAEVEFKNLKWAFEQLRSLKKKYKFKFSLDCRHPEVVRQVLEQNHIDFLNDVSGLNSKEMQKLLKSSQCDAFVMHSLTIPPSKEDVLPMTEDPFQHLINWWKKKKLQLKEAGVTSEHLVFDPGIGFGKSAEHNIFILKNLQNFSEIHEDIMVGHSRKSYQALFSDQEAAKRDLETALVTRELNQAYTQYLRVHDVSSQKSALRY